MGSEATCRVRFGAQVSEGKALLETTELLFRGDFRLRIPFSDIETLTAEGGALSVSFGQGTAVFELGRKAAVWETKIRNPRGLLDKLGVKAGMRVSVLGVSDGSFLGQLERRDDLDCYIGPRPDSDLVFYAADTLDDLAPLDTLRASIKPNGAIWVVSPKGKGAVVKDTDVMTAAREAGLVDTKVASFSDTHTALKLVIPVAKR